MFRKFLYAPTFVLVAVAVSWSFAQSSPSDYEMATVAFDFRVKKAREGDFMKMLDVTKELSEWQPQGGDLPDGVELEKVDRIFGAMSLPDDIATFESMSAQEKLEVLPFDYVHSAEVCGCCNRQGHVCDDGGKSPIKLTSKARRI